MEPQTQPALKLFELTIWVSRDASKADSVCRQAEVRLREGSVKFAWNPERDRDVGYFAMRHIMLPDDQEVRDMLRQDEFIRHIQHSR